MEVVVVSTGATRLEKLQSNPHQQTNTQFYRPEVFPVAQDQRCQSTVGEKYHIPRTCSIRAHLGASSILTIKGR